MFLSPELFSFFFSSYVFFQSDVYTVELALVELGLAEIRLKSNYLFGPDTFAHKIYIEKLGQRSLIF